MSKNPLAKPCTGCIYLGYDGYCDYLSITGRRRPCPAKDCTAKTLKPREKAVKQEAGRY